MVVYEGTKLIFLSAIFAIGASHESDSVLVRNPRQAHGKSNQHDQSSAETGFLGGGGVENSKYFQEIYVLQPDPMEIEFGHVCENPHEWEQRYEKKDFNKNRHQGKVRTGNSYQHLPEHDKYEFGHRRGNEHHVIERYEKAIPHEGQFKTKVRWADKKGGHGEHYWDYNHAGHGGNGQSDGDGGYSDPVPIYHPKSPKQHQKRQSESERKLTLDDVETPAQPRASLQDDIETEIGSTKGYEIQRETSKGKRGVEGLSPISQDSHLYIDLKSGEVVDEKTGSRYILQPVN